MQHTTLCYIERGEQVLLLHRVSRKDDPNGGKWIGVGGHIEENETEEQCLLREVKEETGLTLTKYRKRGVITFLNDRTEDETMHLYTSDGFTGDMTACDEGELAWVNRSDVPTLPMWAGDYVFLELLQKDEPYFEVKLKYSGDALIESAVFRHMRISDYDDLYALWTSCKGMGLNDRDDSREGISAYLDRNPTTCFVCAVNGTLAGAILCGHDGRRGFIHHTAVRDEYRRQGIAARLVRMSLNALKDCGIRKVALVAFTRNENGNAFWEKMGFPTREDLTYRNRTLMEMTRIDT